MNNLNKCTTDLGFGELHAEVDEIAQNHERIKRARLARLDSLGLIVALPKPFG